MGSCHSMEYTCGVDVTRDFSGVLSRAADCWYAKNMERIPCLSSRATAAQVIRTRKVKEGSSFVKINNARKIQEETKGWVEPTPVLWQKRCWSGTWDLSDPCAGFNDDCQTAAWLIFFGLYRRGLQMFRFSWDARTEKVRSNQNHGRLLCATHDTRHQWCSDALIIFSLAWTSGRLRIWPAWEGICIVLHTHSRALRNWFCYCSIPKSVGNIQDSIVLPWSTFSTYILYQYVPVTPLALCSVAQVLKLVGLIRSLLKFLIEKGAAL